jgi:hypothetical protein
MTFRNSRAIRTRVLAASAALVAASIIQPSRPAAAATPPPGSRILVVNRDGVRDLSTGTTLPLPGAYDIDVNPVDGRVALTKWSVDAHGFESGELIVAGARAECPRTLGLGGSPSWAADGFRMVANWGGSYGGLSTLVPGAPGEGRQATCPESGRPPLSRRCSPRSSSIGSSTGSPAASVMKMARFSFVAICAAGTRDP